LRRMLGLRASIEVPTTSNCVQLQCGGGGGGGGGACPRASLTPRKVHEPVPVPESSQLDEVLSVKSSTTTWQSWSMSSVGYGVGSGVGSDVGTELGFGVVGFGVGGAVGDGPVVTSIKSSAMSPWVRRVRWVREGCERVVVLWERGFRERASRALRGTRATLPYVLPCRRSRKSRRNGSSRTRSQSHRWTPATTQKFLGLLTWTRPWCTRRTHRSRHLLAGCRSSRRTCCSRSPTR